MASQRELYRDRLYENQGFPALVNLVEPDHRRVLDVGCGNGANMRLLAARGHEVAGLTLSEAEAKMVREQGFTCQVSDIAEDAPPFSAQSFDALLFSHVLEHLALPEVALKRYTRLLRLGGGRLRGFAKRASIRSALGVCAWAIPIYRDRVDGSHPSAAF